MEEGQRRIRPCSSGGMASGGAGGTGGAGGRTKWMSWSDTWTIKPTRFDVGLVHNESRL